jgi:hypothetical protein
MCQGGSRTARIAFRLNWNGNGCSALAVSGGNQPMESADISIDLIEIPQKLKPQTSVFRGISLCFISRCLFFVKYPNFETA